MMVFVWWLAAGLVLGIIEVVTVDLIFLMLAISAVLAAGAAALGVDPARAVAVEDATSGAASAAAAGFATVVGVDRGAGADALRAAGATVVVDDLDVFLPASRNDIPETA